MTTAAEATPDATEGTGPLDGAVRDRTGGGAEVAARGRTTVSERVVARLATALTTEVPDVGGVASRLLGVTVGTADRDRDAQVTARVTGGTATATVRCSVAYPAPVRATTERLRAHLVDRLGALTGLEVSRVDVVVTALPTTATTRRVR